MTKRERLWYRQTCRHCGERFVTKREAQIYCTDRCRSRAWMKRHPRVKLPDAPPPFMTPDILLDEDYPTIMPKMKP